MGIGLFDYQLDAIKRMKNGCILCGGVGSGKSRTALGYYFKENGGDLYSEEYTPMDDLVAQDLIIITTARKRDSKEWELDMAPFLLSTNPDINLYKNCVVVDSWNNIQKYDELKNCFFIFDEQRVVGYGAWSKSFIKIAKQNDWILLSATPGDTWMDYIPVFIANGFYKNKTEFCREHVVWSSKVKFPKVERYLNQGRLIKYRNEILITMDFKRPTVSHHIDIFCDYDAKAYKDITKRIGSQYVRWNPFTDSPIENGGEFCQVQRRIVNTSDDRQLKLLEIFEQHPKLIIFYNFDYELELLKELFTNIGAVVAEYNGHKHEQLPFGNSWIYLVQYAAGQEAWNCTTTDTMVFFSQNYSYRTMEQASGRIARLNTPYSDLYYYHLKSKSTIDLGIARALDKKQDFNASRYAKNYMKEK